MTDFKWTPCIINVIWTDEACNILNKNVGVGICNSRSPGVKFVYIFSYAAFTHSCKWRGERRAYQSHIRLAIRGARSQSGFSNTSQRGRMAIHITCTNMWMFVRMWNSDGKYRKNLLSLLSILLLQSIDTIDSIDTFFLFFFNVWLRFGRADKFNLCGGKFDKNQPCPLETFSSVL